MATHEIDELLNNSNHTDESHVEEPVTINRDDVIPEEEAATMPPPNNSQASDSKKYTWRIDLAKTEQYWSGWFKGLSAAFLEVPAPKMLLLAGVDRLDRELTVGQMQGILFILEIDFLFHSSCLCVI